MKAILYVCFIAFILLLMFAVPQHEANACKRLPITTESEYAASLTRKVVHQPENVFVYNGQELMIKNTGDIDYNGYCTPFCDGYFPNGHSYEGSDGGRSWPTSNRSCGW